MSRVPGTRVATKARIWQGQIPGTFTPGFVEQELIERRLTDDLHHRVQGRPELELHKLTMGDCNILFGREDPGGGALRWHISISHPLRYPSWDETKVAKYRLMGPDVVAAMLFPPPAHYVNAHRHVFQLWELLDGEASDTWRQW